MLVLTRQVIAVRNRTCSPTKICDRIAENMGDEEIMTNTFAMMPYEIAKKNAKLAIDKKHAASKGFRPIFLIRLSSSNPEYNTSTAKKVKPDSKAPATEKVEDVKCCN